MNWHLLTIILKIIKLAASLSQLAQLGRRLKLTQHIGLICLGFSVFGTLQIEGEVEAHRISTYSLTASKAYNR